MENYRYQKHCEEAMKGSEPSRLNIPPLETTVLQGLLANYIESGIILNQIKKVLYYNGKAKIDGSFLRFAPDVPPLSLDSEEAKLLLGILGMAGEVSELCQEVYQHIQRSKKLDRAKIREDLGDLAFSMTVIMEACSDTWGQTFQENANKISQGYKT